MTFENIKNLDDLKQLLEIASCDEDRDAIAELFFNWFSQKGGL